MPHEIDRKKLEKLLAEKVPQREIANRLNIPRSSLQRIIKSLNAPPASKPSAMVAPESVPVVDMGKLTPEEVEAVRGDFWELIEWWRERRLQRVYRNQPRETARATFHVEKEYIKLIHREAETEGVSITEVVNKALRKYFETIFP